MKAREFLAQAGVEVKERNLIKQPLTVAELKKLAKRAGGPEHLVAPKRRKEAEGLSGDKLITWLAADGGRVRRPIIDLGSGDLHLGFAGDVQAKLAKELG